MICSTILRVTTALCLCTAAMPAAAQTLPLTTRGVVVPEAGGEVEINFQLERR